MFYHKVYDLSCHRILAYNGADMGVICGRELKPRQKMFGYSYNAYATFTLMNMSFLATCYYNSHDSALDKTVGDFYIL